MLKGVHVKALCTLCVGGGKLLSKPIPFWLQVTSLILNNHHLSTVIFNSLWFTCKYMKLVGCTCVHVCGDIKQN